MWGNFLLALWMFVSDALVSVLSRICGSSAFDPPPPPPQRAQVQEAEDRG